MTHSTYMKEQGFTLVELIVAISIFAIIGVGTISLIAAVFTDSQRQGRSLANADQSRKLANQIMQELRNATSGSNGAYAIATANAQELSFYTNADGGTDIEKVRYYVQNGALLRGVVKQSGTPPVYTGAETSRVVQNDVANGSNAIFLYYNDAFDDNTDVPLTQPVNIAHVTYIRITLDVLKRTTNNQTSKFTVNAGAALRTVKTNLGD